MQGRVEEQKHNQHINICDKYFQQHFCFLCQPLIRGIQFCFFVFLEYSQINLPSIIKISATISSGHIRFGKASIFYGITIEQNTKLAEILRRLVPMQNL